MTTTDTPTTPPRDEARGPSSAPRSHIDLSMGRAAYIDEGEGDVILLVHGLPGSARDFRWLSPWLADSMRVIRVDLPGFGESEVRAGEDASPCGRARFVIELTRALGVERAVLLGHSMGGLVACEAAALAPDLFSGIALVSSPGLTPHEMFKRTPFWLWRVVVLAPWLTTLFMPLIRKMFEAVGFRNYSDSAILRTLQCGLATSFPTHAERVRALTHPTLVAWCEDDAVIEPELMAELAATCPGGPREIYPTGGHNPQKSRARELSEALVTWIERERHAPPR